MERINVQKGDLVEVNLLCTPSCIRRLAVKSTEIGVVVEKWTLNTPRGNKRVISVENGMARYTVTPKDVIYKFTELERSLMNL